MISPFDAALIRAIVKDELEKFGIQPSDPVDDLATAAVEEFYAWDSEIGNCCKTQDDWRNLLHALIVDVAEETASLYC